MARLQKHHTEFVNGEGLCSKPMWGGMGGPAGFCDQPAWGKQKPGAPRPIYTGGFACPGHGGPTMEEFLGDRLVLRFTAPPSPSSEFVEAEREGAGVNAGAWLRDGDFWILVLGPAS